MRSMYTTLYTLMSLVLILCIILARRSDRKIRSAVALLDASLLPPIVGNIFIISSGVENYAALGYYIYFIGMDFAMFALVNYTAKYCKGVGDGQQKPDIMYYLLIADAVQLLLNLFTGHAFGMEKTSEDGYAYYKAVPHWGQFVHRMVIYIVFLSVIAIFIISVLRSTKIYRERFSILLAAMVIVGLIQSYFILSRSPIDRSMIGYGIFGILVFYFSIYYRPLRLLDRMLSNIISDMTESIFIFDMTGNCIWANDRGCELADIKGTNFESATVKLMELFGNPGTSDDPNSTMRMVGCGSNVRYYTLEENKVEDDNGRQEGSYLRINDVTEAQLKMKRELYEATHDRMTGLYTREFLYTQIEELIQSNPDTHYYVAFVDIKNFKIVNDIFGTDFGDHAIMCVADWIRKTVSERGCYGRLAGDTFGICVPESDFDREKLEREVADFTVRKGSVEHHLLIHIGIYRVSHDDKDVSVMFDRAHLSLSTIQDEFHIHSAFYDDKIREQLIWNQEISSQLQEAIRTRQLRPYLQPIADGTGRIVGAEALARWIHPEYGFLAPYKFIPVFEKNGMIVEADKHMWRCACEILSDWQEKGYDLFISVNISPKDFYFIDVVSEIRSLAEEYRIDKRRLRIEITETVMMNDNENRLKVLNDLRDTGFIVEMDDFGSGYSSLNMLKDMPVDVLKIDMKFLDKGGNGAKSQTIIRNIISLSKELGIVSLTEGVETENEYAALTNMGCQLFQGYYFAKPLPVEEFVELYLRSSRSVR